MRTDIRIEELCVLVGVSTQTINNWYKWKRDYADPDDKLAKILPDYHQEGTKRTRYWTEKDVKQVIKFKESMIRGRYGVMGDLTQRRYIKRRDKECQGEKLE